MTRTQAYRWLAKKLDLPVKRTHIGGFEMDQCQMTIDLCNVEEEKEALDTEAKAEYPGTGGQTSSAAAVLVRLLI